MEEIVLVDEKDNEIGTGEKMAVHTEGKLHRAFSVFIFNGKGETLLQKRADSKYHWGGAWSNTCCSHPHPGEKVEEAVHRKMMQELGIDCSVKKVFDFVYKVRHDNGLFEHEFDHIFIGRFDGAPTLNPEEASDWKWMSLAELKKDIRVSPNSYTPWLKIALDKSDQWEEFAHSLA